MNNIASSFSDDHRRCDESFIAIEQAVSKGTWEVVEDSTNRFIEEMEHHFQVEEGELFPALEKTAVEAGGPVQVMRMEHEQMRQLFLQLRTAVEQQDARRCLDVTETLLMIMQQHNFKEENILYPMADRSLGSKGQDLARSLRKE